MAPGTVFVAILVALISLSSGRLLPDPQLHTVDRQRAQEDFCFRFAPACCVQYVTCTTAKCDSKCAALVRRCAMIDVSLPKYSYMRESCAQAASSDCSGWCMSRKCAELLCNGKPAEWRDLRSYSTGTK